jgi:hypothetical protein
MKGFKGLGVGGGERNGGLAGTAGEAVLAVLAGENSLKLVSY